MGLGKWSGRLPILRVGLPTPLAVKRMVGQIHLWPGCKDDYIAWKISSPTFNVSDEFTPKDKAWPPSWATYRTEIYRRTALTATAATTIRCFHDPCHCKCPQLELLQPLRRQQQQQPQLPLPLLTIPALAVVVVVVVVVAVVVVVVVVVVVS